MTADTENQSHNLCCLALCGAVDARRRHFCMGTVILCLSVAIIIAESQQPSYSYAGYWMGCAGFIAALTAFVCAAKPHHIAFVIAAFFDAICTILNASGSVYLLVENLSTLYTAGWMGIVQAVIVMYHCFSCVRDADVCCRWKALDEVDYASSSAATATNMETGGGGRNGDTAAREDRGQDRRRRRTQSPPVDFRLPDEVPRLPDYEELNKSEGLPPRYDSPRIPPPAFSTTGSVE
ncbi:unnamed protein product [Taenia asiatica]|uniref:MARVEL domain-containing protein n=1 Tax=Taenia asiatica TaxID=60517 RepID=A0A0R3WAC7_TAEAS|nr:unnamed protein product [Taenia asiatica]